MKYFLLISLITFPFSCLFADEPASGTLIQISGLGILLGMVLTGTVFQGFIRDYIFLPVLTFIRKNR